MLSLKVARCHKPLASWCVPLLGIPPYDKEGVRVSQCPPTYIRIQCRYICPVRADADCSLSVLHYATAATGRWKPRITTDDVGDDVTRRTTHNVVRHRRSHT